MNENLEGNEGSTPTPVLYSQRHKPSKDSLSKDSAALEGIAQAIMADAWFRWQIVSAYLRENGMVMLPEGELARLIHKEGHEARRASLVRRVRMQGHRGQRMKLRNG